MPGTGMGSEGPKPVRRSTPSMAMGPPRASNTRTRPSSQVKVASSLGRLQMRRPPQSEATLSTQMWPTHRPMRVPCRTRGPTINSSYWRVPSR